MAQPKRTKGVYTGEIDRLIRGQGLVRHGDDVEVWDFELADPADGGRADVWPSGSDRAKAARKARKAAEQEGDD